MAYTQTELAAQMLAQLRMLDPSVSAEVGTPERKILDTVAQALSDAQVDVTQLSGALDVDSKVGANLDNFLALFGFGRQQAVKATGFVNFTRTSASTQSIRIPAGTQVQASGVNVIISEPNQIIQDVLYETTFDVTLAAGELSVSAPIRAIIAGSAANVAANRVTDWASQIIYGIQGITNPAPITGGVDLEDDDEVKVRFKNTIFRNLAGTQDQYIALAASAAFTTKVNVVGPISRYREYIQVPDTDDNTAYGNGLAGEYTSALSTIPYSKYVYANVPTFLSNGKTSGDSIFWRQDTDWRLNTTATAKYRGDAYRLYNHPDTDGNPQSPALDTDPRSVTAAYRPNITFTNVYLGTNTAVTALKPGATALFEHSYMSTASRNDYTRAVTNCVDVYVDGSNDTTATTVIPIFTSTVANTIIEDFSTLDAELGLSANPTMPLPISSPRKMSRYNWRRAGTQDTFPVAGHVFIQLFWQPVTALPSSITILTDAGTSIFYLNEHYWLVEDHTENQGTIRARNGLEWSMTTQSAVSPADVARTGPSLQTLYTNFPTASIEISNYIYDKNIVDIQSASEAAKQVTTDVLVHKARMRYFFLNVTVMYSTGANPDTTNQAMRSALDAYFKSQYFGAAIQLSDLLEVCHSVPGIDNVRWTNPTFPTVYEASRNGTLRGFFHYDPIFDNDFFIGDDELPRLAEGVLGTAIGYALLPGLEIHTRAQNTWTKL